MHPEPLYRVGTAIVYARVTDDTDNADGEAWAWLVALIIGGELGLLLKQFPQHAERVNQMLSNILRRHQPNLVSLREQKPTAIGGRHSRPPSRSDKQATFW